ncbi:sensor histidine kinase [Nocardioides panaciterrulae]|uniref:Two-component system LytT family sensor kinase n=1 Tax=Nocardioides panaciterrulae TaxID=661492 RepID=A0A7Y9E9S0_9ACTN|nr:histidine kinase [Nocardioides panaciterrulae]NYD43617.1 two-component system LytT family sensor kinase [Nocardioides panaciterrulae]
MARWRWLRPGHLGTEADRETFRILHTASLTTTALRGGLNQRSAEQSVRHLRSLLGTAAAALTDTEALLAWDGVGAGHARHAGELARHGVAAGSTTVHPHRTFACDDPACGTRHAVVAPLTVEERVVGTLQVYSSGASAGLVQATSELAGWVSGQLELGELEASRTRLAEAELRALRAQISPHFIYNSLTAIASFVRTDPVRARELLLDFADFARYSFQRLGEYTTLEEELRSIERYLVLEQARFGDRLRVTLRIAPEVLPVSVPVLSLQPLVENAVRHGLAGKAEGGSITILAEDADREAVISIEDDGVGESPDRVRRALAGDASLDSVGLGNVDERLRSAFGDDYGLVVETAPGAGTKVTVRVPKYAPGVHP